MPEKIEPQNTADEASQTDLTEGSVGDVEAAGETTAAAAIHGPVDDSPVGAETLANIKISDAPKSGENDNQ